MAKIILIINTTDKTCEVALADGNYVDRVRWQWQETGTETLKNIRLLLKEQQKELADIQAILVNRGPGSFTGSRVGVTIANTLAWSLDIPVFGYRQGEPASPRGEQEEILKKAKKIVKTKFFKIALPYYA